MQCMHQRRKTPSPNVRLVRGTINKLMKESGNDISSREPPLTNKIQQIRKYRLSTKCMPHSTHAAVFLTRIALCKITSILQGSAPNRNRGFLKGIATFDHSIEHGVVFSLGIKCKARTGTINFYKKMTLHINTQNKTEVPVSS